MGGDGGIVDLIKAAVQEIVVPRLDALHVAVEDVRRGQGPATTPTPSTVGEITHTRLKAEGKWTTIEPGGDAVLTQEEAEKLKRDAKDQKELSKRNVSGEWVVVEGLTPKLKELVAKAAEAIGQGLVLVNSERHFWAVDPHGGKASAPDLFVTHPAMWKEDTSDVDQRVSSDGFCFGVPGVWDCRDCIEVLGEAKVEMGEAAFGAIGEGLAYLGRISVQRTSDTNVRMSRVQSGRVIVFDCEKFYLLWAVDGRGTHCQHGKWTEQGSTKAIVDFIASAVDRVWVSELEATCTTAKVRLCVPGPGSELSSVLGSGAFGRVFHASDAEGRTVALKVSLDQRGVDAISSEASAYELSALKAAGATTTMIQHVRNGSQSAALVIRPVSDPLPRTQIAIASALLGLWKLSQGGLCHGDARRVNVIWIESEAKALWTDLHSLSAVKAGEEEQNFEADVEIFAKSLDVAKDGTELAKVVTAAMKDGATLARVVRDQFF